MIRYGKTEAGVRWWAAAALMVIGVLLWAACTGGAEKGPGPGQAGLASCQPLSKVERFRYIFDFKIESPQPQGSVDETAVGDPPFAINPTDESVTIQQVYNGSFIRPDRYMIRIETQSEEDAAPIELVFIGEESWLNAGDQWLPGGGPNAFPPLLICESILSGVDLTGLAVSAETIDGQPVSHFRLEETQLNIAAVIPGFGPLSDMGRLLKTSSVDIWLAEEGWPARLEVGSKGAYPSGREMLMEISLEFKDINAKDIKIEPPQ